VIPSVFPIISVPMAKRFTSVNGADFPDWLSERLDAVAGDPDAERAVGVEVATEIGAALLAEGVPGLHIYTINRSASALAVWQNLGLPR
jgi:methylenetetrahydrofolate reductase (NADPH)